MNISSTPFIRNDYWPDYNDINELNKRIDETENEISLVNIRLSADIENVSNNLNSYINNQADTTIANNIIVNSLNANYAEGKFANFSNTNTDNAYIENLTVNKPVFDITLNTPHIENTTSLGGNFYNTNLIDPKFSGDASGDFNTINVNVINANTANISNLFVNIQLEPVTSSAVLGYDIEGRVIPIHASYDVAFPENANYLFTDSHGTAFAGTAATEVGETNNLITSFAVKNALDDYANTVNNSFNLVNNSLNDIDSWQNTFENNIANSFNDVNNGFNDVNNGFNDVNNGFNDVNNTFNSVNNVISNVNNIAVNVDTLASSLSSSLVGSAIPYNSTSIVDYRDVEHIEFVAPTRLSYISQMVITFPTAENPFTCHGGQYRVYNNSARTITFTGSNANSNFITSDTISLQKWVIVIGKTAAESWGDGVVYTPSISGNNLILTGSNTLTIPLSSSFIDLSKTFTNYNYPSISLANTLVPVFIDFNSSTNTLIYSSNVAISNNFSRIYNEDMRYIFNGCAKFNQSVNIPDNVTDMGYTFSGCTNFNQPINIPDNVTDMGHTFDGCAEFNQSVNIPGNVISIQNMFSGCTNLNKPINILNNITDMSYAFNGCTSFNQPINISSNAISVMGTFNGCTNFNQPINIPSSVTSMKYMLYGCTSFNQNDIYVHTSGNMEFLWNAFRSVSRIGNIHIPASVPEDTSNEMYNCLVNGRAGYTFEAANIKNDL